MSVFVDSSVWFAAANERDSLNGRARALLRAEQRRLTSDHVLVETSLLLNRRLDRSAAERFWEGARRAAVEIEIVTLADLEAVYRYGRSRDKSFEVTR